MQKQLGILAAAVTLTAVTGCTSMSKVAHPTTTATLSAQSAQIVTRPTEYAYKTIGTATGHSSQVKIFGFTVGGDTTAASVQGLSGASKLESLAAYRAVKSLKGDAFFQLTTEEDKTEFPSFFPFIYNAQKISVTGKVLKIEDLGTITAERADKMEATAAETSKTEDKGLFGGLFD